MRLPQSLLVHTVQVTPYLGTGSNGPLYGSPFDLRCLARGSRRLVRDADGSERVSSLTLYAGPGQADSVPAGSQVTWGATNTTVMAATDHDSGGLGAPDHTEVVCE